MALSGFRFFGQDIGGFAGPRPDKELFLRWIQYGLFTPRFTLHSWNDDGSSNMPWLYEDLIPEVQALFQLRKSLLPYIYSEANASIEKYEPLIRPIFLDYPGYDEESDAFLLGRHLLVCPVFDKGKEEIEFDLPGNEGWYLGSTLLQGHVKIEAPLHGLPPYFIKAGTIFPMKEGFQVYLKQGEFGLDYYQDESLENKPRSIQASYDGVTLRIQGVQKEEKLTIIGGNANIIYE